MAGGRVFDESMKALAPFGRLVTYGIASREQNEVRTGALMRRSHAVVGFWLMHCLRKPEMVGPPLQELFELVAKGELRVVEGETYPLSEVRRAHEDMQPAAPGQAAARPGPLGSRPGCATTQSTALISAPPEDGATRFRDARGSTRARC